MFKCELCEKEFKKAGGLALHRFKTHNIAKEGETANLKVTVKEESHVNSHAPVKAVEMTTFFSPRSPNLRIVVYPTNWQLVSTPVGQKMQQVIGKSVEFENGLFRTADPELIDFLENKYPKDDRFPIFNQKMLSEMRSA